MTTAFLRHILLDTLHSSCMLYFTQLPLLLPCCRYHHYYIGIHSHSSPSSTHKTTLHTGLYQPCTAIISAVLCYGVLFRPTQLYPSFGIKSAWVPWIWSSSPLHNISRLLLDYCKEKVSTKNYSFPHLETGTPEITLLVVITHRVRLVIYSCIFLCGKGSWCA